MYSKLPKNDTVAQVLGKCRVVGLAETTEHVRTHQHLQLVMTRGHRLTPISSRITRSCRSA